MKGPDLKKFAQKKMPQKVDFTDYDKILENFDAFCDEFESRASNAFMRGDQNDGRVTGEVERTGENCPVAVREIAEPGPTDLPAQAAHLDVPSTDQ